MTRWDFDLIVEGRDLMEDDALSALSHASASTNDDISPHWRSGVQYAGFMRDGECLEEAVLTGVRQVESVGGVKVVGVVDTSFVTINQIAERSGHSERSVEALIAGAVGPGDFPGGLIAVNGDCTEWPWDQVVAWFRTALDEQLNDPNAAVFTALTDTLRARASCAKLERSQQQRITALLSSD